VPAAPSRTAISVAAPSASGEYLNAGYVVTKRAPAADAIVTAVVVLLIPPDAAAYCQRLLVNGELSNNPAGIAWHGLASAALSKT